MTPALAALERPAGVPAAALSRLGLTAEALRTEASAPGVYRRLLAAAPAMVRRSASVLAAEINETGDDLASLVNAERLARACAQLFGAEAVRASGRARATAMRRAGLFRDWHNDIALPRRDFVPERVRSGAAHALRILPGAEPAIGALSVDPLLISPELNLLDLSELLARWVAVR